MEVTLKAVKGAMTLQEFVPNNIHDVLRHYKKVIDHKLGNIK